MMRKRTLPALATSPEVSSLAEADMPALWRFMLHCTMTRFWASRPCHPDLRHVGLGSGHGNVAPFTRCLPEMVPIDDAMCGGLRQRPERLHLFRRIQPPQGL